LDTVDRDDMRPTQGSLPLDDGTSTADFGPTTAPLANRDSEPDADAVAEEGIMNGEKARQLAVKHDRARPIHISQLVTPVPSDSHSTYKSDQQPDEVPETTKVSPSVPAVPSIPVVDLAPLRHLLDHATSAGECRMLLNALLSQWGVPLLANGSQGVQAEDRVVAWLLAGRDGPVHPQLHIEPATPANGSESKRTGDKIDAKESVEHDDTPSSSAFSKREEEEEVLTPSQSLQTGMHAGMGLIHGAYEAIAGLPLPGLGLLGIGKTGDKAREEFERVDEVGAEDEVQGKSGRGAAQERGTGSAEEDDVLSATSEYGDLGDLGEEGEGGHVAQGRSVRVLGSSPVRLQGGKQLVDV
jgi:hypothetical protein